MLDLALLLFSGLAMASLWALAVPLAALLAALDAATRATARALRGVRRLAAATASVVRDHLDTPPAGG